MSVATARAAAVPRPWVDRLLAAVPILSIYLWLCVLYGWEAWGHVTPWLNSDELETAQLSRAVAETGETARRGVPYPSHALYPYVLAPVWWIQDVGQAYGVAKFLNVLLMTSVVFPTYGLARMVVSRSRGRCSPRLGQAWSRRSTTRRCSSRSRSPTRGRRSART